MTDLARLLPRVHRVRCWERADRDPVELLCTCGWSEVRWPQRTNKHPDCPIHGQTDRAGDDSRLCGCSDELSELTGARCGNCRAAFESQLARASRELLDVLPTVWQGSDEAVRLRALVDGQPAPDTEPDDDDLRFQLEVETGMSARWFGAFAEARDQLAQALALLRSHADVCSRHGEPERLRTEADRIEAMNGPATPGPTREQVRDAIADALSEHVWAHGTGEIDGDGIGEAADAVLALFGRSAPEPPAEDEESDYGLADWTEVSEMLDHGGHVTPEGIDESDGRG